MLQYPTNKYMPWVVVGMVIFLQSVLLFFVPRSNFVVTFSIFSLLFFGYFFIIKKETIFSFTFCIALAILLRLLALFSLPALSDDYFRFIWDGKMTLLQVNPFQYTPQEYLQIHGSDVYLRHLFDNMNSQKYHTVYPPVMQYIFTLAAYIGGSNEWLSVVVMKFFIVAAEAGSMRILYLLAKKKNIDPCNILWYLLNPLIITEISGNAHFEGILIFFFAVFLYLLLGKKVLLSAVFFMLAVCTKMIPLMLAPLMIRYIGFKKAVMFGIVAVATGVLLFLPFIDKTLIAGMSNSLRLFFHLFEFNASVFYFIRWVAYFFVDFDVIEEVAPVLGIISFIIILAISFWSSNKINFIEKCLWIFAVYLLFSTMVHPWYSSILIMLAALSSFRFPVVFSLLVLLSYFPYSMAVYNEDNGLWLIAIEYSIAFSFTIYEILQHTKNRAALF